MAHPTSTWFGTRTEVARAGASGLNPFPDIPVPTGYTLEAKEYLAGCTSCSKKTSHKGWKTYCLDGPVAGIAEAERLRRTDHAIMIEFLLWALTHFKWGLPTSGYIYNSSGGGTPVQQIGDGWTVSSVGLSGTRLLVSYAGAGESDDPARLNTIYFSSGVIGEGLTFTTPDHCLQVGDVLRFTNTVYTGRVEPIITKIDTVYPENAFYIYLDPPVPNLLTKKLDAGQPVTVRAWRRVQWPDSMARPQENFPMICGDPTDATGCYGQIKTQTWEGAGLPAGGKFTLLDFESGEARHAYARKATAGCPATVQVVVIQAGTPYDITDACVDDGRFNVHQSAQETGISRLYLGTDDKDGNTVYNSVIDTIDSVDIEYANLTSVTVKWWPESSDETKGQARSQRVCKHAYHFPAAWYNGYTGVEVESGGTRGWTCFKRDDPATNLTGFTPVCYQPGAASCANFEIAEAFQWDADRISKWIHGGDVYIQQQSVGGSGALGFRIGWGDGPSLCTIFGHFNGVSPSGYHILTTLVNNGKYGQIIGDTWHGGAFLKDTIDIENGPPTMNNNATLTSAALDGALPSLVTGWTTKPRGDDNTASYNDTTDPTRNFRIMYYGGVPKGWKQDTITLSGTRSVATFQLGAWYQTEIIAPVVSPNDGSVFNVRAVATVGQWDDDFNPTGSGTYGMMTQLALHDNKLSSDEDTVIVSGTILAAAVDPLDSNKIIIDCSLGTDSAGTQTAPKTVTVTTWPAGGNCVDSILKVNNYYSRKVRNAPHDYACPGMAITFPDHSVHGSGGGNQKKFLITQAEPHSGTAPTSISIDTSVNETLAVVQLDGADKTICPFDTGFAYNNGAQTNPVDYITTNAVPGTKLYAVDYIYDQSAGAIKKYKRQNVADNWVNVDDAGDTIAPANYSIIPDPVKDYSVGRSYFTGADSYTYRLLEGEYMVRPEYNREEDEVRWSVFPSTEQADLAWDITYTDTSSETDTLALADVVISAAAYAALDIVGVGESVGENGEYFGLYLDTDEGAAAQGDLVKFVRTSEATASNFWTSGDKTARNVFYIFDLAGTKYIRLHADFANYDGLIYIPGTTESKTPAEIWTDSISFHNGIPFNYENYFAKPDQITLHHEGLFDTAAKIAALVGESFEVALNAIANPEKGIDIDTDEYNNAGTNWTDVAASNYAFLAATGQIFFTNAWLATQSANTCHRYIPYLMDRTRQPNGRMISDIIDGIGVAQWVETAGYSTYPAGFTASANWSPVSYGWSSDSCLGSCRSWFGGMTYQWCSFVVGDTTTRNHTDPCNPLNIITQDESNPHDAAIATYGGGHTYSAEQTLAFVTGEWAAGSLIAPTIARGLTLDILKSMPADATMLDARIKVTITGGAWEKNTISRALTNPNILGGFTDSTSGWATTTGSFSLVVIAFEDAARTSGNILASAGPFTAPASGVESSLLDITSLIAAVWDNWDNYYTFGLMLMPPSDNTTGLPTPTMTEYVWCKSCPGGSDQWKSPGDCSQYFESKDWTFSQDIYRFDADSVSFSQIYVKFQLPNDFVDGREVATYNLPGQS